MSPTPYGEDPDGLWRVEWPRAAVLRAHRVVREPSKPSDLKVLQSPSLPFISISGSAELPEGPVKVRGDIYIGKSEI